MMVRVLVIGPLPGSSGGIGVMMSHIQNSRSSASTLRFVNSGASGEKRLFRFLACLFTLLFESKYDLVHINLASNGSTIRKVLLSYAIRLRRKPYVIHLHGGGYKTFYAVLATPLRFFVRLFFARAQSVVVLGNTWAEFVVDTLGVSSSSTYVLPNAVPGPAVIDVHRENSLLFAGKLVRSKGIFDLLSAAELVSPEISWRLELAGDCPDPEVMAAIGRSTVPIQMHGWIDREQVCRLMSKSAVFILPSHAEGLPLSLLDAMAHGMLPVVTPVGSIPEVIKDGENGVLVEVGNPSELAKRIEEAFYCTTSSSAIRKNARVSWEKDFSMDGYRIKLDQIYTAIFS